MSNPGRPDSAPPWPPHRRRFGLAVVAGVAAVAALFVATLARIRFEQRREAAEANLRNIAESKVAELEAWRTERTGDARLLADLLALGNYLADQAAGPEATERRARLVAYLGTFIRVYDSDRVTVFGRDGRPVLHIGSGTPATLPAGLETAQEVAFIDLHRDTGGGLALGFAAPVRDPATGVFAGAVALGTSPERRLFPLLRRPPVNTATAETLLVRRDGDDVLFLSETRHRTGTALALRHPLADDDLLSAQALLNRPDGLVAGHDYRGEPVLGVALPVPGTPWLLVAKIDRREAFSPLHRELALVGAAAAALLGGLGWGFYSLSRRQQAEFALREAAARSARREALERLGAVLRHANDAILLFDDDGRILEANDRSLALYGRTPQEMIGLTPQDLRAAGSRDRVPADFSAARTDAGTVFETLHRRKDGTEFPVEVSARPVGIGGRRHVLSIIRDISQRKAHEREIGQLNRLYVVLTQINQAIVRAATRPELFAAVCRVLADAGGFRIAWVGWHDPAARLLVPVAVEGDPHGYVAGLGISSDPALPSSQGPSGIAFRENRTCVCNDFFGNPATRPWHAAAIRSGFRSSIALPLRLDDRPAGILTVYAAETDFFGPREVALLEETAADISFALATLAAADQRRAAEAALRASEHRLDFLLTAAPAVIFALRPSDRAVTFISRNVRDLLGYEPADFIGNPGLWRSLVHPDDLAAAEAAGAGLAAHGAVSREYRCRHRDGTWRWMQDDLRLVRGDDGAPTDIVGYWLDIGARKTAELQLRKLSRTIEQAPLAVAITDRAGTIEYVNPAFCAASGYTAEELLGGNPRVLKSDRTPPATYTEMWSTLTAGRVWRGEIENRRKDGSYYVESAILAPVLDDHGRTSHYVALKTDITAHKLAEDIFKQVQERYRLIAENTADVIWLLDLEAGKFVYCSPSVERLLGFPPVEVLDRRLADIMPPAEAARAERDLRERIARFAAGDRTALSQTDEVDQLRRDGTAVPTEIVTTLLPDAAGRITRVLGVTRDITERKRALAALRERDLRYRAELENDVAARTAELAARNREVQALLLAVPDMVLRLRPDGTVVYRQPARSARGARLLASADEPLPADLLGPSLALGRRTLAGEDTAVSDADLALPEGPVTVELRAAAVGPDEFVVFVRDITVRKRLQAEIAANLEKERQVSEMKTRFISVTSHEFRTPMAAAMGSAELLANHLDRLAPAKRQELFDRIKTSLLRMTDMLDDVLTLNRIDAKRTAVQPAPTDLRATLRSLIDEIRVGDRDAHRFTLETPAGAAPFVTDPNLFHHIASNLISNAVRYSPPGTVVTVRLAFGPAGARLSVSDQGIGIPEADRDRIFQPFERGTNVGTIKGTGLGLNIVKRMTELLGGKIAFAPVPGGGTCFTLDLPALSPDSGPAR